MIRRIAGLVFLLLGVAGLALSAAGILELWRVRPVVADRADQVGAKAEHLLGIGVDNLRKVASLLDQGRKDLDEFRDTAQTKAPAGPVPDFVQTFLVKKLLGEFAPHLDDADRTLNIAVDAAVVINSVLQGAHEIPLVQLTSLDTDQLRDLSGELKGVIGSAQKLSGLLQNQSSPSAKDLTVPATEMKEALTRVAAKLDSLAERAAAVKNDVAELRAALPGWLMTAAIAVTAFLAWFALGQLCLTIRGAAWLFHRNANPTSS